MRHLLRIVIAASFVCLFAVTGPVTADPPNCEGGYSVPTKYETTIRYYNSSQQPVGWETYYCNDWYISNGTLSGTWLKQTDVECCNGQTFVGYFYLCPSDGLWHQVAYIGDTNCS